MRILVTGGAGFIGSHLVDALLADGHDVTVVDDLSTGKLENLAQHASTGHEKRDISPHLRFVEGSILDEELMESLIRECDVVYHLAATVGVKYVIDDPLRCILTNVRGTEVILDSAYRHGVRVLFASTSEVYGRNPAVPWGEGDDRVLGSTRVPRWSYATAKALDEHLCYAYLERGLRVSIVRYFNAYGPRLDPQGYGSVIAKFIGQALRGEPLTVYGSGRQSRSFTYVDDSVRGTILAAITDEAVGEAFNIACKKETSILELAQRVITLTGSPSTITMIPYSEIYGAGFEDTPRRLPKVAKAREALGFTASVPLDEGLRRTIAWFRQGRQ